MSVICGLLWHKLKYSIRFELSPSYVKQQKDRDKDWEREIDIEIRYDHQMVEIPAVHCFCYIDSVFALGEFEISCDHPFGAWG